VLRVVFTLWLRRTLSLLALASAAAVILLSTTAAHGAEQGLCDSQNVCATTTAVLRSCVQARQIELVEQRPGMVAVPLCSDDGTSARAPAPVTPLQGGTMQSRIDSSELWLSLERPQHDDHSPKRTLDPLGQPAPAVLRPAAPRLTVLPRQSRAQPLGRAVHDAVYRPPQPGQG
jgi:hypothetical protein